MLEIVIALYGENVLFKRYRYIECFTNKNEL